MTGFFITFEGGEGSGKTTQIKKLAAHLQLKGESVVVTREPGGTVATEEIRNLLVTGDPGKWSSIAEALLNYASRDAHLRDVIRPALAAGKTVLCDRFIDSTRAYQGIAGDCPLQLIDILERHVVGLSRPDLTFVFDLEPSIGLARAGARGAELEDRYERKGLAFHQVLRRGFLEIAAAEPSRCVVLDSSKTLDEVWLELLKSLKVHRRG